MKTRIITSIIAIVLFIPFLLLADATNALSLVVICQLISAMAVIELLRMTGFLKKPLISVPCIAISVFVPFIAMINDDKFFSWVGIIFFVMSFYMMSNAVFTKSMNIQDYATMFIMLFYVVVSASSIVMFYRQPYGEYLYLLPFLGAWASDTGGYFVGRKFGKHKLIPEISPKKTVEGAIGGIVFCIAFVGIYVFVIGLILELEIRMLYVVISAALVSVVSMFGDLVASLLKRHYGIKDYGDVFPGHGGMLDRFDSVLATAPFLYIAYTIFKDFNFFVQ